MRQAGPASSIYKDTDAADTALKRASSTMPIFRRHASNAEYFAEHGTPPLHGQ